MFIRDGNEVLKDILINNLESDSSVKSTSVKHPIYSHDLSLREKNIVESFFKYVYLIHPSEVEKAPVIHPEFIRYPTDKEVYKEPKQLDNFFLGRKWSRYVTVDGKEYRAAKNNVRAKYAFRDYTNVNLTNDKTSNRLYGYTVAHIFGGANNPILFSAGFNLALILDGFVKFTDEQHLNSEIFWALTSASYLLNYSILNNPRLIHQKYGIPFQENDLFPLFPMMKDNKIIKEGFRIKYQRVPAFPFWFDINVIRKNGNTYKIEKVRPDCKRRGLQ
ncbi:hypothetical protein CR203_14405 [Salipaludibacillus neizhouensis]|uniref:Uncharacterized protein n=1 Tax=Salipaludibacillus neizhouensis TaxID=885475 RepID=A0A3A9K2C6_9BACI|nr:hypothetical protein [Salipaludibacillus neizhouensis]RKL66489.1 hypothetical protein CR203_14405 [Salipaludibacillus neizhouensis]